MDATNNNPASDPRPIPTGLVIGRDLMFTARVTGIADELGYRVKVAASAEAARSRIIDLQPPLILVDLAAGDAATPEALTEYRHLAGPSAWLVAVGPHVDAHRLAEAREAGCQLALPRSKFAAELPGLMQQHLGNVSSG